MQNRINIKYYATQVCSNQITLPVADAVDGSVCAGITETGLPRHRTHQLDTALTCKWPYMIRRSAPLGIDVATEAALLHQQEMADVEGIVQIAGAGALIASVDPNAWAVVASAPRSFAQALCAGP